jgi:two-component system phosphate regulon response regulator PhoB
VQCNIFIVDDEAPIRETIAFVLSQAGFACKDAPDAETAAKAIAREAPDLILLDWMLPGLSGIEFARELRRDAATREIPIIMLSARGEEEDKVRGLNTGADDYITKPFKPKELVARIQAVLRRIRPDAVGDSIQVGPLVLDPGSHRVSAAGHILELAPTEFRLLQVLMSRPERVFSREQLLDLVWGRNIYVAERTVDMHISNVRKTLGQHGLEGMIETVRGVGYRLSAIGLP